MSVEVPRLHLRDLRNDERYGQHEPPQENPTADSRSFGGAASAHSFKATVLGLFDHVHVHWFGPHR